MKITAVKAYPVWLGQLLVKVETDTEIYGWGEAGMPHRARAVIGALQHFSDYLIGADPMRIGSLWQEMYRNQYFEEGRILTAAISRYRYCASRHCWQSPGCPRLSTVGGIAPRLRSLLCHDKRRQPGSVD